MDEKYLAFTNARLIDGRGGEPKEGMTVLVKNRNIMEIGPAKGFQVPTETETIDASDLTLMPGLIDAHIHLLGLSSLAQLHWLLPDPMIRAMRAVMDAWKVVDAGFTTVRDCGSVNALHLRQGIEDGDLIGPRIVAAGRALTQTAGHGDTLHYLPLEWAERNMFARIADGISDVRRAVREQIRDGADFIKLMTTGGVMSDRDVSTSCQYSLEEIRAIVEEAANVGVKTSTHAQGTQGIKNALICGVDCVEHGFYLDDECLEIMVKQNSYLVPTLAIVEAIKTRGPKVGVLPTSVEKAAIAQKAHLESFKRAYKAGVTCGLGTDYLTDPMTPMGENAVELELYVTRAGLKPMEAIVCATANNAEILGLSDLTGTIEPGKRADLLLINGDPAQDISILRDKTKITAIYKEGKKVPRLGELGVRGIGPQAAAAL